MGKRQAKVVGMALAASGMVGCIDSNQPWRGSLGGIEASQAAVEAIYVESGDGNGQLFTAEATEAFDSGFVAPRSEAIFAVNEYGPDVKWEEGRRYLLFIGEDLSGSVPLLRFAYDMDDDRAVPGFDQPAYLFDGGMRDGLPVDEVLDCIRSRLDFGTRVDAVRALGRDTGLPTRTRGPERVGSWLTLMDCDPGDDGYSAP